MVRVFIILALVVGHYLGEGAYVWLLEEIEYLVL